MTSTTIVKAPSITQGANITVTAPFSGPIPDGYYSGKTLVANAQSFLGNIIKGFMLAHVMETGGTGITITSKDLSLYNDVSFLHLFYVFRWNSTGGNGFNFFHIPLNKTNGFTGPIFPFSIGGVSSSTTQGNMRLQSSNTQLVINYNDLPGSVHRIYNISTNSMGSEINGSNLSGTVPAINFVSGSQNFSTQLQIATRDILLGYNIT